MSARGAMLCFVSAVLVGYVAHVLETPLAWVLGPLVVTAAFSISGVKPFAPLAGRRVGQVIIGGAIGLNLTAAVVATIAAWLPMMLATALTAMLVGSACAIGLSRFGRVNVKTAYFCMMPGGLSEMANIGSSHGAHNEHIALSQALRVALVVCLLPPLLVTWGLEGNFSIRTQVNDVPLHLVPFLFMAGLAGVVVVRILRLNNPWMIGSLVGVGSATALGYFEGRMPRELFYSGQFLLGIAIGARFRREVVIKLKRFAWISSFFVLLMTGAMLLFAVLLTLLSDLSLASAALAASPGGLVEMAMTAQVLHLNIALVTAFHVTRATLVNGFTIYYYRILDRLGFFRIGSQLLDRYLPPSINRGP